MGDGTIPSNSSNPLLSRLERLDFMVSLIFSALINKCDKIIFGIQKIFYLLILLNFFLDEIFGKENKV